MRNELIERVARAIYEANTSCEPWQGLCGPLYDYYRDRARAALAAYDTDDRIKELREALEGAADELETCAEQFRGLKMGTCAQYAEAQVTKARTALKGDA